MNKMDEKFMNSLTRVKVDIMTSTATAFMSSEIFFKMPITIDDTIPSAATDGTNIIINTKWWTPLSVEEQVRVLCHECGHRWFNHHTRANKRVSQELNNIAMDIVIESLLVVSNIGKSIKGTIGELINHDGDFSGNINGKIISIEKAHTYTYEQVLDMLLKHIKENPSKSKNANSVYNKEGFEITDKNGNKKTQVDEFQDGKISDEEGKEIEEGMRRAIVEHKEKGTLNGTIAELLSDYFKPKINWKQFIRDAVSPEVKSYQTYSRINRRANGRMLPGVIKEGVDIVYAMDTSGSMGENELKVAYGELQNLFKSMEAGSINATIMLHTTDVYAEHKLKNDAKVPAFKIISGGTSHIDVFEKAEKMKAKVLICFTDGYTDFPSKTNIQKVLWIVTDKKGLQSIPSNLGKKLYVSMEEFK